ncbi:unnamed protein product [Durusdinium trenchii]|uniref:Glutamine amidotransferase type-2 domain-containing protein n=2 Tax=Durusdinium trenchii TaxID=1381693 RepID=A0ABP0K8I3_9DINO
MILLDLFFWYWLAGVLHEVSHLIVGCFCGSPSTTLRNLYYIVFLRRVEICTPKKWCEAAVRHSGWVASAALFVCAHVLGLGLEVQAATGITALEAFLSDFLVWTSPPSNLFFCGNFGLILLNEAWAASSSTIKDILELMVEVTMVRGAQSGGVVTFASRGCRRAGDLVGLRTRVVNQKRTTLSRLLRNALDSMERWSWKRPLRFGRVYAGHTRFATSSKASLDGTHPHIWSRPQQLMTYVGWSEGSLKKKKSSRTFEIYVCHNGDFDFLEVGGQTYELGEIQCWLEKVTWQQRPSNVDSAAIAGVMDLLRTQGLVWPSARYGFLFGIQHRSLDKKMPPLKVFKQLGDIMDQLIQGWVPEDIELSLLEPEREQMAEEYFQQVKRSGLLSLSDRDGRAMAAAAIDAFFDNDLLHATSLFMKKAKGSFGLCVTCSLDADRQMIIAARGQTMSMAFYPQSGMVLYGSEQAAMKAAVGVRLPGKEEEEDEVPLPVATFDRMTSQDSTVSLPKALPPRRFSKDLSPTKHYVEINGVMRKPRRPSLACNSRDDTRMRISGAPSLVNDGPAMRYDLDDLAGEICLLDWGDGLPSASSETLPFYAVQPMMQSKLKVVSVNDKPFSSMAQLFVPLEENPLVLPLPKTLPDPVGNDIKEIPQALKNIQTDWRMGEGQNRASAMSLSRALLARLREKMSGQSAPDGIDLLVTGCEVSLWLGEQFATDLAHCFKHLNVRTVSANKLLGLSGQQFSMCQTGHDLSDNWDLHDCVVLIISHSGGTFASLAVSKLLQAVTKRIFVVTSEWDTQIGKQLRALGTYSHVFSTNISLRPAEPCSVSVAATQQLLTQILMYLAFRILSDDVKDSAGPVITRTDLAELEHVNRTNIEALQEIVGYHKSMSKTERELRRRGRAWAQHVLETPRAWILCAAYVAVTVTCGIPPITAITTQAGLYEKVPQELLYVARALDAAIYIFLPQIMIFCIRLLQCRPLLHRMTGRTVVIGDVPWVAQCVEAFLSKLVACTYSATALAVFSANPADHLVHRMTHRVVRGSLLACGRPDGRLVALTSAEQSVCLSVNQASSIQSLGVTCESITIGHNPHKLPLTAHHVCLQGSRPQFLCEHLLPPGCFGNLADSVESNDLWAKLREDLSNTSKKRIASSSVETMLASLQKDSDGQVSFKDFERGFKEFMPTHHLDRKDLKAVFDRFDQNYNGALSPSECKAILQLDSVSLMSYAQLARNTSPSSMDHFNIQESTERIFGARLINSDMSAKDQFKMTESQRLSMMLYESRIASLQRAVAFFVMFHQMGKTIAEFWPWVSFGILRYRMDRTHSIMRIATTASPVSGANVREKMVDLETKKSLVRVKGLLSKMIALWRQQQVYSSAEF